MLRLVYKRASFWAAVVALSLGFFSNIWGSVDQSAFNHYQEDSDALVYGGLAHCVSSGFAQYGLWADIGSSFEDPKWVSETRSVWLDGVPPRNWVGYASQIGLQGWAYCLIYRLGGSGPRQQFMRALEGVNAVLLALTVVTVVVWIRSLGGDIGVAVPIGMVIFSPWLTQIGRSVYWVSWTWFLPMTLAIYLTRAHASGERENRSFVVFSVLAFAVFVKSACGYEFISFVLVVMMLPFVNKFLGGPRSPATLWRDLAVPALGGLAGFVGATLVHAWLRGADGSVSDGYSGILADAARRTSLQIAGGSTLPQVIQDSLSAPLGDLLRLYAEKSILVLPGGLKLSAAVFLAVIGAAWGVIIFRGVRRDPARLGVSAATLRLGMLALVGVAAPMSWFVLAKGHSYIHQHIDPVLWVVPVVPLALALLGSASADRLKIFQREGFARGLCASLFLVLAVVLHNDLGLYSRLMGGVRPRDASRIGDITTFRSGRDVVFIAKSPDRLDWDAKFFVHVYPTSVGDLPPERKKFGFDNLDFDPKALREQMPTWSFYRRAVAFKRRLPATYKVRRIVVGQYRAETGRQLWTGEIRE